MAMSKETFELMIKALDKDGDGDVSSEEYKAFWLKAGIDDDEPRQEADFAAHWAAIDADGDGNLTVKELAAFFNFDIDLDATNEMTDDDILAALALYATLAEENKIPVKAETKDDKKEEKVQKRDLTVKTINTDLRKEARGSELTKEQIEQMCNLLDCCQLGELSPKLDDKGDPKKDELNVHDLLEANMTVRFEDSKGEMPLHKLTRVKVTDKNKNEYTRIFLQLTKMMREEAKVVKGKDANIYPDINHADAAGKTPLALAIEQKNHKMIELLFSLGKEGPDTLMCNKEGWSILHVAVNTNDLDIIKKVSEFITPQRNKMLMQTKDGSGRRPLHIAAYKCDEEIVTYVTITLRGAEFDTADKSGNNAAKLADRAGRRKSREIIEAEVEKFTTEKQKSPGRRKSKEVRYSKEDLAAVGDIPTTPRMPEAPPPPEPE